jgi:hypothetical protein
VALDYQVLVETEVLQQSVQQAQTEGLRGQQTILFQLNQTWAAVAVGELLAILLVLWVELLF